MKVMRQKVVHPWLNCSYTARQASMPMFSLQNIQPLIGTTSKDAFRTRKTGIEATSWNRPQRFTLNDCQSICINYVEGQKLSLVYSPKPVLGPIYSRSAARLTCSKWQNNESKIWALRERRLSRITINSIGVTMVGNSSCVKRKESIPFICGFQHSFKNASFHNTFFPRQLEAKCPKLLQFK